jgi:hypothetical protein
VPARRKSSGQFSRDLFARRAELSARRAPGRPQVVVGVSLPRQVLVAVAAGRNIYRELDATRRREAVRRGRELRLL